MKWWLALAAIAAIGLAVWLARPAMRPEPPRMGEYAIEEPPRVPGQSARDVEPAGRVTAPSLQPRYERSPPPAAGAPRAMPTDDAPSSPAPSVNPIHVTPGQLHLRNLAPKSAPERFIKRIPQSEPYFKK